jgi:hypothetical protein
MSEKEEPVGGMETQIQGLIKESKIKDWDNDALITSIIEEKLNCHYLQKKLVKNFDDFFKHKIFKPHFHSKKNDKNIKEALPIFYRHGISKIMTKIMEDVANDDKISDFFLNTMIEEFINMEPLVFTKLIHEDNIEKDFLIHWMDMKKGEKSNLDSFFEKNKDNATIINNLLLNLFSEDDFNTFVDTCNYINKNEKESWKEYYNNVDIEKRVREEENKKRMGMDLTKMMGFKIADLIPKSKNAIVDNYKVITDKDKFEDF